MRSISEAVTICSAKLKVFLLMDAGFSAFQPYLLRVQELLQILDIESDQSSHVKVWYASLRYQPS